MKRMMLTAGLMLLAPQLASAGPYITAGLGSGAITNFDVYDNSTSFKLGIGANANEHLRFEGSFLYLGEFEVQCNCNSSLSVGGIEYAVIGGLPVNDQVALNLKAGLYMWSMNSKLFGQTYDDVDDGTNLSLGIGTTIKLAEKIDFTINYDRYSDISGGDFSNLMFAMNFGL